MMEINNTVKFSFYGCGIEVKCQNKQTIQDLQRDYSFFLNDKADIKLFFEVFNKLPAYSQFPSAKAYLYTNQNICYRDKNLSFIDYFGKGLAIIDHRKNLYKVFSPDSHLRHEIVFLYILALVGKNLGLKNLHRVHGLGLEVNNEAILVLLPSGGGKTTLLLDLVKNKSVKLISEESPLIDVRGQAFPFPFRIGVSNKDKPEAIPQKHLHLIQRMGIGPKYVIDINFFKDKISSRPLPVRHILCGVRCLGNDSYIQSMSKYNAFKKLVENSVFGVGLYQGAEFLIQRGIGGLFLKSPVLFSRLRNVTRVLLGAKTYLFAIGCDRKKNAETFLNFCRENIDRK